MNKLTILVAFCVVAAAASEPLGIKARLSNYLYGVDENQKAADKQEAAERQQLKKIEESEIDRTQERLNNMGSLQARINAIKVDRTKWGAHGQPNRVNSLQAKINSMKVDRTNLKPAQAAKPSKYGYDIQARIKAIKVDRSKARAAQNIQDRIKAIKAPRY